MRVFIDETTSFFEWKSASSVLFFKMLCSKFEFFLFVFLCVRLYSVKDSLFLLSPVKLTTPFSQSMDHITFNSSSFFKAWRRTTCSLILHWPRYHQYFTLFFLLFSHTIFWRIPTEGRKTNKHLIHTFCISCSSQRVTYSQETLSTISGGKPSFS